MPGMSGQLELEAAGHKASSQNRMLDTGAQVLGSFLSSLGSKSWYSATLVWGGSSHLSSPHQENPTGHAQRRLVSR